MYVILLRNKSSGQQGEDFVKYEIGDFVSKPVTGICKIEDILYLTPQDEKIINFIIYGTWGCYRKAKAGNIITANEYRVSVNPVSLLLVFIITEC